MKTTRTARPDASAETKKHTSQPQAGTERPPRSRKVTAGPSTDIAKPFGPITTQRISEEISARIRKQIASGALPPGTRLPTERQLSEQFQVSRMAVREGMRTLEVAGLITLKKGRHGGAFINESSAKLVTQQIRDMIDLGRATLPMLMEARLMVMDMVVRLACERATAADLRAMEDNVEKTEQLTETGHFQDRTLTAIEFNKLLADATRNYILGALVEGLSEVLRQFFSVATPRPIDSVVPARRKLISQIRAHDADGAAATMAEYLENIQSYLLRQSRNMTAGKTRIGE